MLCGCKPQYINKATIIEAAKRMKTLATTERNKACKEEFNFSWPTLCNRMRDYGISMKDIKITQTEYKGL